MAPLITWITHMHRIKLRYTRIVLDCKQIAIKYWVDLGKNEENEQTMQKANDIETLV